MGAYRAGVHTPAAEPSAVGNPTAGAQAVPRSPAGRSIRLSAACRRGQGSGGTLRHPNPSRTRLLSALSVSGNAVQILGNCFSSGPPLGDGEYEWVQRMSWDNESSAAGSGFPRTALHRLGARPWWSTARHGGQISAAGRGSGVFCRFPATLRPAESLADNILEPTDQLFILCGLGMVAINSKASIKVPLFIHDDWRVRGVGVAGAVGGIW